VQNETYSKISSKLLWWRCQVAYSKEQNMIKRMELSNTAWSQSNMHIEQYQQGKKDVSKKVYFLLPMWM
jgi:hypothetical protein